MTHSFINKVIWRPMKNLQVLITIFSFELFRLRVTFHSGLNQIFSYKHHITLRTIIVLPFPFAINPLANFTIVILDDTSFQFLIRCAWVTSPEHHVIVLLRSVNSLQIAHISTLKWFRVKWAREVLCCSQFTTRDKIWLMVLHCCNGCIHSSTSTSNWDWITIILKMLIGLFVLAGTTTRV